MGSLKRAPPPSLALIVLLGDFHFFFRLSLTTWSSVKKLMVGHLIPTLYLVIASAALIVTLSLVASRFYNDKS